MIPHPAPNLPFFYFPFSFFFLNIMYYIFSLKHDILYIFNFFIYIYININVKKKKKGLQVTFVLREHRDGVGKGPGGRQSGGRKVWGAPSGARPAGLGTGVLQGQVPSPCPAQGSTWTSGASCAGLRRPVSPELLAGADARRGRGGLPAPPHPACLYFIYIYLCFVFFFFQKPLQTGSLNDFVSLQM